jgi:four helix bundle protein
VKDFRHLSAWRKAHALALEVYRATAGFPAEERFGLTSQMRRAAVSVPANVAEGCGRGSDADFGRFLQIALGSASELEYHLILARDLGFIAPAEHQTMEEAATEVKRMLSGLLKSLKARS